MLFLILLIMDLWNTPQRIIRFKKSKSIRGLCQDSTIMEDFKIYNIEHMEDCLS